MDFYPQCELCSTSDIRSDLFSSIIVGVDLIFTELLYYLITYTTSCGYIFDFTIVHRFPSCQSSFQDS